MCSYDEKNVKVIKNEKGEITQFLYEDAEHRLSYEVSEEQREQAIRDMKSRYEALAEIGMQERSQDEVRDPLFIEAAWYFIIAIQEKEWKDLEENLRKAGIEVLYCAICHKPLHAGNIKDDLCENCYEEQFPSLSEYEDCLGEI